MRSFERLLKISAQSGGVVGPFVDGGSIVRGVVTVGSAGLMTGDGDCGGACTGAGGSVDGPLSGCGSRVSPCELGPGSGHSCEAGESITTSGRGGSGGAGRSGTGGRSADKASSSIPMMNRASCRREARTETFFRVRRRSTSRCSIPPTNRVHSRTFVNSLGHPRTFVNGTAKRALVTYSRMVMPLTNFPTLPYHSRTKLKPIPEWPRQRRTKFFRLSNSGTDFHSNNFLLEQVNLPKHKLT